MDKKKIWAIVAIWLVLLQSVFIIVATLTRSNLLVYNLFLINILCGPVCIIFYCIEVKKGVFRENEKEDTKE